MPGFLSRDNWIGATPQENAQSGDWPAFFAIHRLGFQVDLLETTGSARAFALWGAPVVDRPRRAGDPGHDAA